MRFISPAEYVPRWLDESGGMFWRSRWFSHKVFFFSFVLVVIFHFKGCVFAAKLTVTSSEQAVCL